MNKQIFIENVIRFVVMVGDGGWGVDCMNVVKRYKLPVISR